MKNPQELELEKQLAFYSLSWLLITCFYASLSGFGKAIKHVF